MRPLEVSQARGKRQRSSQTAISNSSRHSLGVSWAAYCPAMAATSIGATRPGIGATTPGLVAPALWTGSQSTAAVAGQQSAVPSLHASLAHGPVPGPGGSLQPAQSHAQNQQPGAALWSTTPPIAASTGGPAPSAASPDPAGAARAALFMSQLAAMQAATQAAVLPPLTIPPPPFVAPRAEGAPVRPSRASAQATAALNRSEVWIPYSTSTLGSHSPYPHIRPPNISFECNTPHSHADNGARPASHASWGAAFWLDSRREKGCSGVD